MRAAEKAAAEAAHQLLVAQDVAEVADAAANPIPADVPEGVEPFSMYTVIAGAASTTRTQFTHTNAACEQCDEAESDTRKFERCERCNIVYNRTCNLARTWFCVIFQNVGTSGMLLQQIPI